jgi:hypothetical protein
MSAATSVRPMLRPADKTVAPQWYWRRGLHIASRLAQAKDETALTRSRGTRRSGAIDIAALGEFASTSLHSSRSGAAFAPRRAQARSLATRFKAVDARVPVEPAAWTPGP